MDENGLPVPDDSDNASVDLRGPCIDGCKTDILLVDADGSGCPSPGDTIRYEIAISNIGNQAATGVAFADTPSVYSSLIVGSVTTTHGIVTTGNTPGDVTVGVDVGTIAFGGTALANAPHSCDRCCAGPRR